MSRLFAIVALVFIFNLTRLVVSKELKAQNDQVEIDNLLLNKTAIYTTSANKSLIVDIKLPKIQANAAKAGVKQAYVIQSQNDFHLECEINSQLLDKENGGDELKIYWWFKSARTNRSTILKRPPQVSSSSNGTQNQNLTTSPNKITIVSRIYIDCASRENEGEYFCAAFYGPVYHWSNVELKVLVPTKENDQNGKVTTGRNKSCETVSYKTFGPNPARIVEYTAVIFNMEFEDVRLKCRTEKVDRSFSPSLVKKRPRSDRYQRMIEANGGSVRHVWLDNQNRQIRDTSGGGYELVDNGDLIIRNLTFQQFGQFACITRRGNRIDSVSTFIFPIKAESRK